MTIEDNVMTLKCLILMLYVLGVHNKLPDHNACYRYILRRRDDICPHYDEQL